MTTCRSSLLPGIELPDPETLTGPQPRGWNRALCGRRLFADQLLGTVEWTCGGVTKENLELYVCRPLRSEARAAQPGGGEQPPPPPGEGRAREVPDEAPPKAARPAGRAARLPRRPHGSPALRGPRATGARGLALLREHPHPVDRVDRWCSGPPYRNEGASGPPLGTLRSTQPGTRPPAAG